MLSCRKSEGVHSIFLCTPSVSFFHYSFAVSVLHALHAVYDVDAGWQVVLLRGQLYAVKVVDPLLAGGHVSCKGADAVGDRLNHDL